MRSGEFFAMQKQKPTPDFFIFFRSHMESGANLIISLMSDRVWMHTNYLCQHIPKTIIFTIW